MMELFRQIQEVFLNLFNSQALMATLAKPEMTVAAFIVLNLVIFIETGLLWPILPGERTRNTSLRPWLPSVTDFEARMAIESMGVIAERLLNLHLSGARH